MFIMFIQFNINFITILNMIQFVPWFVQYYNVYVYGAVQVIMCIFITAHYLFNAQFYLKCKVNTCTFMLKILTPLLIVSYKIYWYLLKVISVKYTMYQLDKFVFHNNNNHKKNNRLIMCQFLHLLIKVCI